jgi:hypothetical protein
VRLPGGARPAVESMRTTVSRRSSRSTTSDHRRDGARTPGTGYVATVGSKHATPSSGDYAIARESRSRSTLTCAALAVTSLGAPNTDLEGGWTAQAATAPPSIALGIQRNIRVSWGTTVIGLR